MNNFLEYLNSKGLQLKPTVKTVADDVDMPKDRSVKPPKGKGMSNGMQPYVGNDGKVKSGNTKGLGYTGDKDLVYDVKKTKKAASIPTAESYEYLELFPKVREAIQKNPYLIENLVHEFKRNGVLSILVGELSSHNETFHHLATIMSDQKYGESVCKKFARAMNEDVADSLTHPHDKDMEDDGDDMHDDSDDHDVDDDMHDSEDDDMHYDSDDHDVDSDMHDSEDDDMHDSEDDDMHDDHDDEDNHTPRSLPAPSSTTLPPAMENLYRAFRTINS